MDTLKSVIGIITGLSLSLVSTQAQPQPTQFVTVAAPNFAAYSSNGVNWSHSTLPGSGTWAPVAYGDGLFVSAAGDTTMAAYSADGSSWTAAILPTSDDWQAMTFGNGTFVAIASGTSNAAVSTNGMQWALTAMPSSDVWQSVAYGNGVFAAIARGDSNAAYSTDGSNWFATTLPFASTWNTLAYGNGVFATVAGGSSAAAYSTNGINWYATSVPHNNWSQMAYGNGVFEVVPWSSGAPAYSTNGINWVSSTMPAGNWEGTAFARGANGGQGVFVAVTIDSSQAAYSSNGITWIASPSGLPESANWWLVAGNTTPNCALSAVAQVTNGFVIGATITSGGCGGLTNLPEVLIEGGGGSGAIGVPIVTNGYLVGIEITNAGFGYSNPPTIYIGGPPVITSEPQSVVVNLHGSATFTVGATVSPLPAYQWSFNASNIAGATDNSYTITNITPTNLGAYSVTVSNVFGLTNSTDATLGMYPYILSSFNGATVLWGTNVTLAVSAGGSAPVDYQWYQNGVAVDGATNADLVLDGVQFTNAGLYSVIVSDAYGSVTNTPVQLVVEPAGVALGLFPGVIITGTVGYSYIVQRTPDLYDSNSWVSVGNVTLTQPTQIWVDTNINAALPQNPKEYYKVLPGSP